MRTRKPIISVSLVALLLAAGCAKGQQGGNAAATGNEQVIGSDLDAAAFKTEVDKGQALLVDVRTPSEYASGHIAGSVNIDWTAADYETRFGALDPKKPVLLYCHSGGRSEQAKEYLEEKGFAVKHLTTGFVGWKKAGYPVEK
ncbi:MAG: rhodanese-like domain-containing protein [Flavobacteriales bacterium]